MGFIEQWNLKKSSNINGFQSMTISDEQRPEPSPKGEAGGSIPFWRATSEQALYRLLRLIL